MEYVHELATNWQALRMHYIRREDHFGLYDSNGSFHDDRLEALVAARGWVWPRTKTGKLTRAKTRQDGPALS